MRSFLIKHLEKDKSNYDLIQYLIKNRNKAKENLSNIHSTLRNLIIVNNKVKQKCEKELEIKYEQKFGKKL